MEFYSAIKRMKWYHLSNMDGHRDYHIKLSKRQISYDITYMWNLKKKKDINEFTSKTGVDS